MKKIILTSLIGSVLFYSTPSLAQIKIFIKAVGNTGAGNTVGTFDGGSFARGHEREIEAIAYSDGLAGCINVVRGGGGGGCKISKTPFTFSMPFSFAVISFKNNLLNGRFLNSVDMVIRKEGEENFDFYKVHMEGVLVSSISEGASTADPSPLFNIELQPQKIAWEITKQSPNGSTGAKMSYGWDFTTNKSFSYSFQSQPVVPPPIF